MSDDGRHGLTIIAFIGSVFSPYYAYRRGRGAADPLDHCAINVALYGLAGKHWTMTERGRASLQRTSASLAIGPSALVWDSDALTIQIDEVSVPIPSRIRGTVKVFPSATTQFIQTLDSGGHHTWWPIAPVARIEANFHEGALRWSGHGYLDANFGDEPLETRFHRWDWARACLGNLTAVLYEIDRRNETSLSMALAFDGVGRATNLPQPSRQHLPSTRWRIARETRADEAVGVVETIEDAPFYARSFIDTHILGRRTRAMHESLSLDRFRKPWVRGLLPFRMPRAILRNG
jgi:carotenoid 1,2-hydratase